MGVCGNGNFQVLLTWSSVCRWCWQRCYHWKIAHTKLSLTCQVYDIFKNAGRCSICTIFNTSLRCFAYKLLRNISLRLVARSMIRVLSKCSSWNWFHSRINIPTDWIKAEFSTSVCLPKFCSKGSNLINLNMCLACVWDVKDSVMFIRREGKRTTTEIVCYVSLWTTTKRELAES